MSDPRRIVLADPLARPRGRSRFAVAGQGVPGAPGDVKMFEWDGECESVSMVGFQTDVGGIVKALAWSPHPAQRHLLALGLGTGRTTLLQLSPSSLSLPLRGGSGVPSATLSIKHSRAVTSLDFSRQDPNLLAAGFERHRSDHSLLIWDVADAVAAFPRDSDGDQTYSRPVERLEVTNTLARESRTHDGQVRPIQQYCPSEAVHSVAWVPGSASELYASAINKVVRLYDLRAPAGGTSAPPTANPLSQGTGGASQWSTRAVHMLTPDPERQNRLASVETVPNGSIVRLWDRRKLGVELAALDVVDGSGIVALEWAKDGNALGVATKEGGVNIWDIVSGPLKEDDTDEWTTVGGMRNVVKLKQSHSLQSFAFMPPLSPARRDIVFITKDGAVSAGRIDAPAVLAASSRGELAYAASSLSVIDPELPPARTRASTRPTSPSHDHHRDSRRESRTDDLRRNRFQLAPERVNALLRAEHEQGMYRSASPGHSRNGSRRDLPTLFDEPEEEEMGDFDWGDLADNVEGFRRHFRHDAAFIMRRRAEEGYGLDNRLLNAAIATRFPGADRIAGTWEFVHHLLECTAPGQSVHNGYDLTYQGLWPVWTGRLGADGRLNQAGSPTSGAASLLGSLTISRDGSGSGASTPRHRASESHDPQYNSAVAHLNSVRSDNGGTAAPGSHRLPHTDRAPQRRMMLAVCGENSLYDTMAEVRRLTDDDQRTKAACWAFFAGEEGPAVTILMRSDEEKHRLMAATIAGFMTQSHAERGSIFWQEHWRSMVDKVDDPYIRAVLARIAGESWDAILYDESLPLLDRVAIAVCNLSDKDLTAFLRNRLNRCVQLGALPGLALTGFTPDGLLLLQRFVDRTGDIQTATLLSSYFRRAHLLPSEVSTVERWVSSYRDLLDSWLAWVPRCAFDVKLVEERRRMGDKVSDGVQTVVVCPVCNNQLTKQTEELLTRKNALRTTIRLPTVRTIACMYCQNALPRCCVCLQHVRPVDRKAESLGHDTMDDAYVSCQTCRHGGHAGHILGWFEGGLDGEPAHEVCPVAGCNCHCASL